ncbi:MAG TPA: nuclease-related domain-containing protein [Solirubrobacteraceae bacterium]|nr:nuclease-related domain-containing protein [Solirubrobacteraceae bacterium]
MRPHAPEPQQQSFDDEATRRTDALLRQLPERDWTVLDDWDPRHGIDHVLVGPSGVFVIASRKPEGAGARVRDGVLWLRRGADARTDKPGVDINRQALDAARVLHREIRTRTGRGPAVSPVVVLWCEFPQRVAESSQLSFVQGRELRSWLSGRPRQLDDAGRGEIVQAIRAIPHHSHRRLPHIGTRRHVA